MNFKKVFNKFFNLVFGDRACEASPLRTQWISAQSPPLRTKRLGTKDLPLRLFSNILKFVFPKRCIICDTILPFGKGINYEYLCKKCIKSIHFITEPYCKKCGAKINDIDSAYCDRCKSQYSKTKSNYSFGFGLCRYTNNIKNSLHKIKYDGRYEYLEFYGKLIANIYYKKIKKLNIDAFIPVPIHRERLLSRNYNQAEVLAMHICNHLKNYNIDIKVDNEYIIRTKSTKKLNKLSNAERKNELTNAFTIKKHPQYKNVCIIDDIYTTGSTIENLSGLIKKDTVSNIYFLVIAVVDNI